MKKIFLPNKFNIIATLVSLSITYYLSLTQFCTGGYPLDDFGNPAIPENWSYPFSIMCFSNYLSSNTWIYPVVAILTYILISLIFRKKIKN